MSTTRLTNEGFNNHAKVLIKLLQETENKHCADCKKRDPRWASWNLGIFICIRCSGAHRSLGTHISKVKSVDLDTWTPEQVENMIKWGNKRANKYWEANLNDKEPTDYNLEPWIRLKYEQKKWVFHSSLPSPSTMITEEIELDSKNSGTSDSFITNTGNTSKRTSKQFGHHYHSAYSIENSMDNKEGEAIMECSNIKGNKKDVFTTRTIKKETLIYRHDETCEIDMKLFQEQLSTLSSGQPSSDLIPKAPPGSNLSWTHFL